MELPAKQFLYGGFLQRKCIMIVWPRKKQGSKKCFQGNAPFWNISCYYDYAVTNVKQYQQRIVRKQIRYNFSKLYSSSRLQRRSCDNKQNDLINLSLQIVFLKDA